mmetsp:Transcript_3916/g.9940  ORF Transcript_3916/g.9940 Transcript_3916/m.9940 type:complete len:139 (-) Transcript_3916:68-484(-)
MYTHFERTLGEVKTPLLIMQSVRDDFCNPQGSYKLFEQASSADKTLYDVQNMGHAVLNEEGCDEVLDIILNWVTARAVKPADAPEFAGTSQRHPLNVTKTSAPISLGGVAAAFRWKATITHAIASRPATKDARRREVW